MEYVRARRKWVVNIAIIINLWLRRNRTHVEQHSTRAFTISLLICYKSKNRCDVVSQLKGDVPVDCDSAEAVNNNNNHCVWNIGIGLNVTHFCRIGTFTSFMSLICCFFFFLHYHCYHFEARVRYVDHARSKNSAQIDFYFFELFIVILFKDDSVFQWKFVYNRD